ncbi:GntR family transcriptional regulator [Rubrobacter aplysinae]|uniref:GntR family transcriptional regulator n=1 Tax=Rubrobacter aplysinae TaxID=909625 RepID=UPI002E14ABD2
MQVEEQIEDLLVGRRYRVGDRLPTEAELVGRLEVSRATVRAGLARLVERGLLERRQGSGTFLVSPPRGVRLRNGLERLETYTVHAHRLGLTLDSRDLRVEEEAADSSEASTLDVAVGAPLVKVSRTLLVDGAPAAWMVDVVPEGLMSAEVVRKRIRPEAMLLDLLVIEGLQIGFSKLSIDAEIVSPGEEAGRRLYLGAPSAALSLVETMYLGTGRPAQWSYNLFLPGHLDLHVVRELYEVREPS